MRDVDSDVELVRFEVFGRPQPQGSATAFVPLDQRGYPLARGGRNADGSYRKGSVVVNITSANPDLKRWRKSVASAAETAWAAREPLDAVSIEVEVHFFMKRPENHWGTGRNAHLLKDSSPAVPLVTPDVDKLLRATLDGLTGIIYKDDSLVTRCAPEEHYAVPHRSGDGQGCRIIVRRRALQTGLDLPLEERIRYVDRSSDGEATREDEVQASLVF